VKEVKRIAYLVRPTEGGIRAHVLALLSQIDRSRFEPVLICPPTVSLFHEAEKIGIQVLPLDIVGEINPRRDFRCVVQLRRILKRIRPDIFHMHSAKAGLIGRIATFGISPRPRLVLTEHVFIFDERTGRLKRVMMALTERLLARATDRIVTVSEALRHELLAEMGINPRKVITIHNGIIFQPLVHVAKPGKLVGTVSRLAPQKGVDHFLRAAALVCKRVPGTRFVIIGDGPYRTQLESLANSLGISERVEFMGYRTDAIGMVRTFDVFVLASTRESFGLTLVEALSQQIPVVASRTGGIPEIVDGETTGLLAEPGNAEDMADNICRLLEDPALAASLAARGCDFVRSQFSAERMAQETQNMYEELLS